MRPPEAALLAMRKEGACLFMQFPFSGCEKETDGQHAKQAETSREFGQGRNEHRAESFHATY